jgi:hypothetical protein
MFGIDSSCNYIDANSLKFDILAFFLFFIIFSMIKYQHFYRIFTNISKRNHSKFENIMDCKFHNFVFLSEYSRLFTITMTLEQPDSVKFWHSQCKLPGRLALNLRAPYYICGFLGKK